MLEIKTEIRIDADPQKVWSVLTDFRTYPEWNPFIRSIEGDVKAGSKIRVDMTPPDSSPMTFKPRVLKIERERELRWIGHSLFPGLFDGEHIFQLNDNKDGTTTFRQWERFTGIFVFFLKRKLNDNVRRGFESMNAKMKGRCEIN